MREHILERIATLTRLADRLQREAGLVDPAAGIINSTLEILIEIREIARAEVAWVQSVVPADDQERGILKMWQIGAVAVEIRTQLLLGLVGAVEGENVYRTFVDAPPTAERKAEQEALTHTAGAALAWMIGLDAVVRGITAPGEQLLN